MDVQRFARMMEKTEADAWDLTNYHSINRNSKPGDSDMVFRWEFVEWRSSDCSAVNPYRAPSAIAGSLRTLSRRSKSGCLD